MHEIEDIIKRLTTNNAQLGIDLNAGASAAEIAHFEQKMNLKLPEDFKTLYTFSNGFYSGEDMFSINPPSNPFL